MCAEFSECFKVVIFSFCGQLSRVFCVCDMSTEFSELLKSFKFLDLRATFGSFEGGFKCVLSFLGCFVIVIIRLLGNFWEFS